MSELTIPELVAMKLLGQSFVIDNKATQMREFWSDGRITMMRHAKYCDGPTYAHFGAFPDRHRE